MANSDIDVIPVWPPSYKVTKHKKAKRVKIKASRKNGIEIVIPVRFKLANVPDVLEEHKLWVIKQLQQIALLDNTVVPQSIHLRSKNERWTIQYCQCDAVLELIEKPGHELVLVGDSADRDSCNKLLKRWIKKQAVTFLTTLLNDISIETQCDFQAVSIRNQQTRWGSCSADKKINLNLKLLFLPQPLIRYVIIHELCHTKVLNHSQKFWSLVEKYEPDFESMITELRHAEKYLPAWL